ncbi:MAG: YqeG family HAD IIIA-type phosphatase [Clostridia bacterium]|nr:YqeG family HAD IIIA-type phosphatase [Clostridia bacterium]
MIFYPNLYCKNVMAITIDVLQKNNIKGLILDVDNTLIDIDRNMDPGVKDWICELKNNNIKLCIVSNSNKIDKVKKVSETLDIPYFYFAKKPFKSGFLKAKDLMKLECENIAAVGDQIMTDVMGANRCKMFSILVEPISEKDIFITKIKRPIEKLIINKYLSKLKKEKV